MVSPLLGHALCVANYFIGATVEILTSESESLLGIYFQDEEMKQIFKPYPELVCIDSTY